MISYEMTSKISLNNRNAFELLDILRDYDGAVYIQKLSEHRQANAKSLLGLLSLNILVGDKVDIIIDNKLVGYEKTLKSIKSILDGK